MEEENRYYIINGYNEEYKKTKDLNTLNGYSNPKSTVEDYNNVLSLFKQINVESIYDVGCGSGLLLKYLYDNLPYKFIPYGLDYNELAINELKSKVFPEYKENFIIKDFVGQKIKSDAAIVMYEFENIEKSIDLDCRYLIFRVRNYNGGDDQRNFDKEFKERVLDKKTGYFHHWFLVKKHI